MKIRLTTAAAGFALWTIIFLLVSCSSPGVIVSVTNSSGGDLSDLRIMFKGGEQSKPILKDSETFKVKVNPIGESSLMLEFVEKSGKKHTSEVDVYFEEGYRGEVNITISPGGGITWKDRTEVY